MKDTIGTRFKIAINYDDCVSESMANIINNPILEKLKKILEEEVNPKCTLEIIETEYIDESEEW